MPEMNEPLTTPADRLSALRKREQTLRVAIALEAAKQQKRRDRDYKKLVSIVGEALLQHAKETPAFRLMMQQVLAASITDKKIRSFLSVTNWV